MKDEDKDEERYRAIFRWICCDVWRNALDGNDGSKEYFRKTREERLGVRLEDVLEVKGGGEEKIIEGFKVQWEALRERMSGGNGKGEREFEFPGFEGDGADRYAQLLMLIFVMRVWLSGFKLLLRRRQRS